MISHTLEFMAHTHTNTYVIYLIHHSIINSFSAFIYSPSHTHSHALTLTNSHSLKLMLWAFPLKTIKIRSNHLLNTLSLHFHKREKQEHERTNERVCRIRKRMYVYDKVLRWRCQCIRQKCMSKSFFIHFDLCIYIYKLRLVHKFFAFLLSFSLLLAKPFRDKLNSLRPSYCTHTSYR